MDHPRIKVTFPPPINIASPITFAYIMTKATTRPFIDPTKVALFITSSKPFSEDWVKSQCEMAERSAESGEDLHLEVIQGDFQGWSPFKLARDYVYPRLFEEPTTFAYVSFVVLDDTSHKDRKLVIVGVHPDSFKGASLEIEATSRMEANFAIDLPLTFHYGNQAITSYPCDLYDNEAERNAA
ncbi:hypothetical protein PHSY_003264 [Pseudozyma hubeiensis SY62]|uniref:Uncharacterized protein n=1 Tax=Pseudozyma hubeiensis (strain SY62) TaxID=1305764 RepID=R9P2P8_PSEHS|nr:hypothetical protein PHSY_003264 [Pseudozyma hubeiensis SY62]GAC95688.1 hypothetical protein PHSY_003264 [Pseudozyma hubeiensis SY62]